MILQKDDLFLYLGLNKNKRFYKKKIWSLYRRLETSWKNKNNNKPNRIKIDEPD